MYLIVAQYSDDAQRKRIEYTFERWKDRARIFKPNGITVMVDGADNMDELWEDLLSRATRENAHLYELKECKEGVERREREIQADVHGDQATAERLLNFVMAKHKGYLERESRQPPAKVYHIHTRKGTAEVSAVLKEESGRTNIRVKIGGYGEVVDFLHGKLSDEIKYLEEA